MKRYLPGTYPLTAVVCAICCAAPALAGPGEPSWTFYKPSNTGIPGDYVHTIYVDEQDRPWIAAYIPQWWEGGMARHEGNNVWTTISNVDHPVLPSHVINDIIRDADGIMWIGTDGGLLRFDPNVGPDSLVLYDTSNTPMPANPIFNLEIDPDGKIWIAIDNVWGGPFGGLCRFDPVANTWDVWTTANGLPWGDDWPGWDWVDYLAVQPGALGGFTVWFGSYEMGMATYRNGNFHWFGNTWPPSDPMTPVGLPSDDPVDDAGNMWIVLWAGLAKRAPDGTYQIVGYPDGLDTEVSMVYAASGGRAVLGTYHGTAYLWDNGWSFLGDWGGSHTYAFAEDSTGAFWIGGIGGTAKFANGTMQGHRLTNSGMLSYWIDAIGFDDAGTVYVSANAGPGTGGYDMFDGQKWTCVNDYNYGLGPPWGLPSDNTWAFSMRANGNLALSPGLGQGAVEWDGSSYSYLIPQGYTVHHLAEDGLGRLWGADDYGIAYLVDEGGNFTTFPQGSSPIPPGYIGGIIVDENNPGWVYLPCSSGIAHTDGETWTIWSEADLGAPSAIRCMDVAADGTFWVGTSLGLVHFEPLLGQSSLYTMANTTLPSDNIDHVVIAPDNSIWMTTFDSWYPYPGGVTCYDGTAWTTWTMENSPLPEEQIFSLETRAVPGGYEMWVGTAGQGIAVLTVETAGPGDLDGDGVVGILDFLALLGAWGPCGDCGSCPADLDGDCAVGVTDFLILLANWG